MSVQKQDHPGIRVLISGISGCGKSTLFQRLIVKERPKWFFIYDHKDGDMSRRFGVRACFDADDLMAAAMRGGLVIFNPAKLFAGDPEAGFLFFCSWVWEVCRILKGKKILAADELQDLVTVNCKPGELCKILDQGRTYQIDCYFICQATNGIHNRVKFQMTEVFAMMQDDENSIDWLENRGFKKDEIKTLKHGEWLYKNKNTGQTARGGKAFIPKNSGRDLRGL